MRERCEKKERRSALRNDLVSDSAPDRKTCTKSVSYNNNSGKEGAPEFKDTLLELTYGKNRADTTNSRGEFRTGRRREGKRQDKAGQHRPACHRSGGGGGGEYTHDLAISVISRPPLSFLPIFPHSSTNMNVFVLYSLV
jgi:hypothetical protein